MKIRTKFSIASAVVVFIVITMLAISTYILVNATLKEKTRAYIIDNTSLLTENINNWLMGKKAQISILKSALDNDFSPEKFQQQLNNQAFKRDFLLMFGTLSTESGLRSNDPARVNPPNIDFKTRAWYLLAEKENNVVFTTPYVDAATKELLLSVVAPINNQGVFKGVLGGDLSLNEIAKSVNTINFNNTGIAFVTDSKGNIITHPEASLNGKSTNSIYGQNPQSISDITEIEYNDNTSLIYFKKLPSNSSVDWYIGVLLDKSAVYASLSTFSIRVIIFAIICISLSIFIFRKLAKHLLSPLTGLDNAIEEIASGGGDLTQRLDINTRDECSKVANNFNLFLGSLQTLVSDVTSKAYSVLNKSEDVKSISEKSSQALSNQFQLIDGLATAMHEMSATSSDIAQRAQEAASLVTTVNDTTESGKQLFQKTSNDVESLSYSISEALEISNQLAEYSNNIEQILSVINGIADQTNLLALNAAIEAARAGEQGRGFAVVADEVRTLASRTQESTTEIKTMIDQIQSHSLKVQSAMNDSKENASNCVENTGIATRSLDEISESVKEIMDRNIQIATAIEQQSVVIEDINKNTLSIKDISVQVDSYAGEQFEGSKDLLLNVRGQQQLLDKFII